MTKLAIVDDHEALREGLVAMLRGHGLEVVGTAGNVAAAIDLVEYGAPDVAVIHIRLPDGSGIELARDLLEQHPALGVMFYTGDADAELLYSGLDSGARGYALKAGSTGELVGAIHTIAGGGSYVDPGLERVLLLARASILDWTGSCSRRARPPRCPSSRRASARSCTSWRKAGRPRRSAPRSACRWRPCAPTCATSSASCRRATGCTPSRSRSSAARSRSTGRRARSEHARGRAADARARPAHAADAGLGLQRPAGPPRRRPLCARARRGRAAHRRRGARDARAARPRRSLGAGARALGANARPLVDQRRGHLQGPPRRGAETLAGGTPGLV